MEKTYNPHTWESKISKLWETKGAFEPKGDKNKKPFCIIMPPPNANGSLHMGHMMFVVEDIATRFARMQNRPTLWLPGTDHAGIETQYVFEKELEKRGKSRFDLGPEKFYNQVMKFTLSHQGTIISQMKSMGFSADWSKLKFTLDEDIIDIVYDTFTQLHKDGHIYRGNRIVNWCVSCNAAFADIEIEHQEREDMMYTLDYGTIKIATTRPETIFADTAVAVNPQDKRYTKLIGKTAIIPLINREVPIIADDHVSIKDGTGALKVTPAHDHTDYEIGLAHKLPEISVIDTNGKLINVPEEFAGLKVEQARDATVKALKQSGKLVESTPLTHSIAIHDRCKTQIEPLISEQWFLRVKELNQATIKALKNDKIKIYPKRFKKVALDWLENEHDWCISRQIWWGIHIPVYYKTSNDPDKKPYIITRDETEAKKYYGEGNYRAETDTFDTWFSSGQWPFASLISAKEFDRFYPTTLMATARDILHKWVTRMIMLGLYRTGKIPFENIYLWGMVTDEKGQKLSKSKGNYGDPMKMTARYGTDALRLALSIGITPGNDGKISEERVAGYRNFCNKLWNVSRFVVDKIGKDYSPTSPSPKTDRDHWILDKTNQAIKVITKNIENYRYSEAGTLAYLLTWNDFADWYIETSKIEVNPSILAYCLEVILKLVHPFAPFVTEAIWQQLDWTNSQIVSEQWPNRIIKTDSIKVKRFENIIETTTIIRRLKADMNLVEELKILYANGEEADTTSQIAKLSGISSVEKGKRGVKLSSPFAISLDIPDQKINAYKKKLEKQILAKNKYIKSVEIKLANRAFIKNAPKNLVEIEKDKLSHAKDEVKKLANVISSLR